MTQFAITVTGNRAVCTDSRGILTAGMTGASVHAIFDSAWEGLQQMAVFRCGVLTVDAPMEAGVASIPARVLLPEKTLYLGIYGTDGKSTVIPTLWVNLGTVEHAADPSGDTDTDPSLPIWATLQARMDALDGGQEEVAGSFTESGTLISCTPLAGTPLEVVAHFQAGPNFYQHLYHVSGENLLDISAIFGGPGTTVEVDGVTATVNADGTATFAGTTGSTYATPLNVMPDSETVGRYRFPPGTYTLGYGNGATMMLYVIEYGDENFATIVAQGNRTKTFTVDNWFSIGRVLVSVSANTTVNCQVPLVLVRGNVLPGSDFAFSGQVYRATVTQSNGQSGSINWSTGQVYDTEGNLVATVEVPERLALDGVNYLWSDFSEMEVSGTKLLLGGDELRYSPQYLTDEQKTQARKNIGAAPATDYAYPSMLTGKKWYACGDSFTATVSEQFTDGLYEGENKVYPFYIGRRCGMDVVNLAAGGQTMAYVEGSSNCFSDGIYETVGDDADYITIHLGINDTNQSVAIGTADDTDNTTFCGAWNVVMEQLITNHPFAHIGIIVPNGAGSEYVAAVKTMAIKWGIPYLDLASGEQVPLLHRTQRTNVCSAARDLRHNAFIVGDGDTHPNAAAHEYESYCIEHWLMTL